MKYDKNRFTLYGVEYKEVAETFECRGCAFDLLNLEACTSAPNCDGSMREDGLGVIFVEVK